MKRSSQRARRPNNWIDRLSGSPVNWLVGGVLVVALVAVVILLSHSAQGHTPSATPAARLTATATPRSSGIGNDATLGGTPDAFTAKYNDPVVADTYDALIDGLTFEIAIDPATGSDGAQHARSLQITPVDESAQQASWTSAQASAIVALFLPADASHVSDIQGSGSVEHIEFSPSLETIFPASAFVDAGGTAVKPGTFNYVCEAGTTTDGCSMGIGV